MKKASIVWLVIAFCLILAGVGCGCGILATNQWDFSRLSDDKIETSTYDISENFNKIAVNSETEDVRFCLAEDGICKVVCLEREKEKHTVNVQDKTLLIDKQNTEKWYERISFFSFGATSITVYLPQEEYDSFVVKITTGDVEISDEIKVDNVKISVSTGDVKIGKISTNTLDVSSSTGGITVCDVTCAGDIKVGVTTGDVSVTDSTCKNLISTGSTGEVFLNNAIASESFHIERSTGDVTFKDSDAAEIFVQTSTGDVTGSLLSEKVFLTTTSTGKISVPNPTAGGKCEIKTSTGDIKIKIS